MLGQATIEDLRAAPAPRHAPSIDGAGPRAGIAHAHNRRKSGLIVPRRGSGHSGNGHDKSPRAMDKCQNLKTAWIKL